jgi:hypothetical protein
VLAREGPDSWQNGDRSGSGPARRPRRSRRWR